jgi:predicted metalloendopeptidase
LSLKGQRSAVIDGLTGEQRFYAGLAQVWRMKMREPAQIQQLKSDPHAPAMARVNGTVRNQPGFHEAYGVKPGDRMYLPPAERVLMW